MSKYSLADIKKELKQTPNDQILDLFIEVLKLRKENKDYAAFRLFSAGSEADSAKTILKELEYEVSTLLVVNVWSFKKMIARIYRNLNKATKPVKSKEQLCHIYLGFAEILYNNNLLAKKSRQYHRYYAYAYSKAEQYLNMLHEDLQYDYKRRFDLIAEPAP